MGRVRNDVLGKVENYDGRQVLFAGGGDDEVYAGYGDDREKYCESSYYPFSVAIMIGLHNVAVKNFSKYRKKKQKVQKQLTFF